MTSVARRRMLGALAAGVAVLALATGAADLSRASVSADAASQRVDAVLYTDFTPDLDGRDFDPGDIISDAAFFDGDAMSPLAIQSFLTARTGAGECVAPEPGTGDSGVVEPCLAGYTQDTPDVVADLLCDGYAGATAEPAAEIIGRIGASCDVSPAVLLVLLQKEQGLVTDTAPSPRQYRSATGYGCPDTADCDAEYYGFFNQLWNAAHQFKRYTNVPGTDADFSRYPVGEPVAIQYSPDATCGSSEVVIENGATAGLYYYTPYQPNAAALANLYGSGDACSAYGNRNFWRIHQGWFPSSTGPSSE